MSNFSMPLLRSLLGTAMLMLFMLQSLVCQVEHAGLLGETSHHADAGNCCSSNPASDSQSPDCHSVCHQPLSLNDSLLAVSSLSFKTAPSYLIRNDRCPDGPVLAIDQPPRLS